MCISRATVSAVSCLVVPAFICIDLLISLVLKINDDDDDDFRRECNGILPEAATCFETRYGEAKVGSGGKVTNVVYGKEFTAFLSKLEQFSEQVI